MLVSVCNGVYNVLTNVAVVLYILKTVTVAVVIPALHLRNISITVLKCYKSVSILVFIVIILDFFMQE